VLRRPPEFAQYTSRDYAALAADLGVTLSVGRKGECWDCDDARVGALEGLTLVMTDLVSLR